MILIYNDVPERWALDFQNESTPIAAGIIDFHNYAMYYMIFILIVVSYFILKFYYSKNNAISYLRVRKHSTVIEIVWTILPGLILILIALPSLKLLYSLDDLIKPNITLKAIGAQWFWNYELNDIEGLNIKFDSYTLDSSLVDFDEPSFRLLSTDNPVLLPILTPIRLLTTSIDVIHSFFVPSLGIKIDSIPGRINHASMYLLRKGTYFGMCAELCGSSHHSMSIEIHGVDTPTYLDWLTSFLD